MSRVATYVWVTVCILCSLYLWFIICNCKAASRALKEPFDDALNTIRFDIEKTFTISVSRGQSLYLNFSTLYERDKFVKNSFQIQVNSNRISLMKNQDLILIDSAKNQSTMTAVSDTQIRIDQTLNDIHWVDIKFVPISGYDTISYSKDYACRNSKDSYVFFKGQCVGEGSKVVFNNVSKDDEIIFGTTGTRIRVVIGTFGRVESNPIFNRIFEPWTRYVTTLSSVLPAQSAAEKQDGEGLVDVSIMVLDPKKYLTHISNTNEDAPKKCLTVSNASQIGFRMCNEVFEDLQWDTIPVVTTTDSKAAAMIKHVHTGKCLTADPGTVPSAIRVEDCSASNPRQHWVTRYENSLGKQFENISAQHCLDANGTDSYGLPCAFGNGYQSWRTELSVPSFAQSPVMPPVQPPVQPPVEPPVLPPAQPPAPPLSRPPGASMNICPVAKSPRPPLRYMTQPYWNAVIESSKMSQEDQAVAGLTFVVKPYEEDLLDKKSKGYVLQYTITDVDCKDVFRPDGRAIFKGLDDKNAPDACYKFVARSDRLSHFASDGSATCYGGKWDSFDKPPKVTKGKECKVYMKTNADYDIYHTGDTEPWLQK